MENVMEKSWVDSHVQSISILPEMKTFIQNFHLQYKAMHYKLYRTAPKFPNHEAQRLQKLMYLHFII